MIVVLSKALTEDEQNSYTESLFESIKHINEYGEEFWYARELQRALEYTEWRNFSRVIDRAVTACENSGNDVFHHFVEVNKTIDMPKSATKEITDYALSRYACYLIVQKWRFPEKGDCSRSDILRRKDKTTRINR